MILPKFLSFEIFERFSIDQTRTTRDREYFEWKSLEVHFQR